MERAKIGRIGRGDNQGRIVTMDILQNNRVLCSFEALDFNYILGALPIAEDENGDTVLLAILTCIDGSIEDNSNSWEKFEFRKNKQKSKSVIIEITYKPLYPPYYDDEFDVWLGARDGNFITHPNGYKNKKQYSVVEDHYRVDGFVWDKAFKMLKPLSDIKQIKVR